MLFVSADVCGGGRLCDKPKENLSYRNGQFLPGAMKVILIYIFIQTSSPHNKAFKISHGQRENQTESSRQMTEKKKNLRLLFLESK